MPTYINAIGTAVPQNSINQSQIANFMCDALKLDDAGSRRLNALYRNTKIKTRNSVLADYGNQVKDYEFFPKNNNLEPFPEILPRMQAYRKFALPLAIEAINDLGKSNLEIDYKSITHLITVSCTGMYAPGLDIDIVQAMSLNTTLQRTCINFMGCYGAYNGLKMADSICKADIAAKVLLVSVELCTLHFQKENNLNNLLSNALFADGAAAVLLSAEPNKNGYNLALKTFYCDILPEGKNAMEWNIGKYGFEMILSPKVPKYIEANIGKIINNLFDKSGITSSQIDYYALHPGGVAILEVLEEALAITKENNIFAYEILEKYGNMSSATVLFVLKNLLDKLPEKQQNKNILSCAFGPGLTIESMILQIV